MKKSPLTFYSLLFCLVAFMMIFLMWLPMPCFIQVHILLALLTIYLATVHLNPRVKNSSPSPLLCAIAGTGWCLISLFLLLTIGALMGYYFTVPEECRMHIMPGFGLYLTLPLALTWFLLVIFISVSLILRKPFWLVKRRAKYFIVLACLLISYVFGGVIVFVAGAYTELQLTGKYNKNFRYRIAADTILGEMKKYPEDDELKLEKSFNDIFSILNKDMKDAVEAMAGPD